jgi:hypothetical protein
MTQSSKKKYEFAGKRFRPGRRDMGHLARCVMEHPDEGDPKVVLAVGADRQAVIRTARKLNALYAKGEEHVRPFLNVTIDSQLLSRSLRDAATHLRMAVASLKAAGDTALSLKLDSPAPEVTASKLVATMKVVNETALRVEGYLAAVTDNFQL